MGNQSNEHDDSRQTILVVDDVEDTRTTLRAFLEHHRYCVLEAINGEQAVEVALREHPDLILMDLFMPMKDGIGATRTIRGHEQLRDVPIVAISAYGVLGILPKEALEAGCNEYVTKPIEFEQLKDLVDRLLKEWQKKDSKKLTTGRKIRAYVNISTYMGHSNTHALTITNISLSGCFLNTNMWLDSGTKVSLGLALEGGKILELNGTVVRHHDEPKGYGIRFFTLSNEERRELALLIAETIE